MQQAAEICDVRVGTRLRRLQLKLTSRGTDVAQLVDEPNRKLVEESVKQAAESTFKVAVVGQIKAGKSSFINALIQHAGFIPTNINPWTTAITRLIFNERPTDGSEGVVRFFDEDEWERLLKPDGKLRALAAKLVPGYDVELIRNNLTAIRQQAKDRLGADFGKLLGREHRIERVTTDVLSQYVCAGGNEVGAEGMAGRYSDITRSADVFLGGGPFDIRTFVIDTPGTNDPYLFRDEITHRALEEADTYIVVLTARQPLSGSDLALLRILRSLQKSRIIIFVNRVDELDYEKGNIGLVRQFVKEQLEEEWPGHDIPLVLGSAMWANLALAGEDAMLRCLLAPGTLSTMQHLGVSVHADELASLDQAGIVRVARRAMFAASGMPRIYEALEAALASAPNTVLQHDLCRSLIGFAEAQRLARARSVPEGDAETALPPKAVADYAALIDGLRVQLQQASDTAKSSIAELRQGCEALVASDGKRLRDMLNREVATAAKLATEHVRRAALRNGSEPLWRFDGHQLRRHLSRHVESAFQATLGRVAQLESQVLPRLNDLLSEIEPSQRLASQRPKSPAKIDGPSLYAMSEANALDLDVAVWAAWWRVQIEPEKRAAQIDRLVRSEFDAVVGKLVASFVAALTRHIENTSKWSQAIYGEIIRGLGARHEHILRVYQRRGGHDSAHDRASGPDNRQRLELLMADLTHLDKDFGRLIEGAETRRAS